MDHEGLGRVIFPVQERLDAVRQELVPWAVQLTPWKIALVSYS